MSSFQAVADFAVDGIPAGTQPRLPLQADNPVRLGNATRQTSAGTVVTGKLTISVRDKQGNLARIERTLSCGY